MLSTEQVIDKFYEYIFTNRFDGPPIRKAAPFIPFLILGLAKLDAEWWSDSSRQLRFRLPGSSDWYTATYQHRYHGITIHKGSASGGQLVNLFIDLQDAVLFYEVPMVVAPPEVLASRMNTEKLVAMMA